MKNRYPETLHIKADMASLIDTPVDSAVISSRPGGGNTTQSFVKGDIVADSLNQVFGPLGWAVKAKIHQIDDWEEEKSKTQNNRTVVVQMKVVQVVSDVELTIKKVTEDGSDTVFVQPGIGYGEVEVGKSSKEAFGMAIKGAATDGLKRCANLLGKKFGMMMASNGSQEDIEYAHNGKRDNLDKARKIRNSQNSNSSSNGSSNQSNRSNEQNNRGSSSNRSAPADQNDRRDRSANESRSSGSENRQVNRGQSDAEDRQRQNVRDDSGPRSNQGQAESHDEVREKSRNEDRAPAEKSSGGESRQEKKSSERRPDTNYDLNIVPITKQDMVDFGATLVERVKEMRQDNDRVGLVKQHINTIKNLDTGIRQRVMERLSEANVDVDKIQS